MSKSIRIKDYIQEKQVVKIEELLDVFNLTIPALRTQVCIINKTLVNAEIKATRGKYSYFPPTEVPEMPNPIATKLTESKCQCVVGDTYFNTCDWCKQLKGE